LWHLTKSLIIFFTMLYIAMYWFLCTLDYIATVNRLSSTTTTTTKPFIPKQVWDRLEMKPHKKKNRYKTKAKKKEKTKGDKKIKSKKEKIQLNAKSKKRKRGGKKT
jgi:rRNA-processing protein FCF1